MLSCLHPVPSAGRQGQSGAQRDAVQGWQRQALCSRPRGPATPHPCQLRIAGFGPFQQWSMANPSPRGAGWGHTRPKHTLPQPARPSTLLPATNSIGLQWTHSPRCSPSTSDTHTVPPAYSQLAPFPPVAVSRKGERRLGEPTGPVGAADGCDLLGGPGQAVGVCECESECALGRVRPLSTGQVLLEGAGLPRGQG